MEIIESAIPDVLIIKPDVFQDERGYFFESFNAEKFRSFGIDARFMQDNESKSQKGVLRGLHFQTQPGQAKLIRCTLGRIWDVAVDIRPSSRTYGEFFGMEISAEDAVQILIPVGFAHGFLVLSEWAEVQYKCSNVYNGATEAGIQWDDVELKVAWPLGSALPLLSERDKKNPSFAEHRAKLVS